jgi:hypothetical protein
MVLKYDIEISNEAINNTIDRLTNQIFKLLPLREEGGDWETPLRNLILEIGGMNRLLTDQTILFSLLCKMESLLTLTEEDDFFAFRKLIFECLGLMSKLKICQD